MNNAHQKRVDRYNELVRRCNSFDNIYDEITYHAPVAEYDIEYMANLYNRLSNNRKEQ